MTAALFIAAVLLMPLLWGLPLLRVASLAGFSLSARIAIAWAGGTVVLTALLTAFAALRIPWSPWLVMAIATIPMAVASRMKASGNPLSAAMSRFDRSTRVGAALCAVIAAAGLVQFAAGAATSADLSYFWGVKAVRFALDGGMDFQWMQLPHMIHLHPNYPPLWPVSLAWGTVVAGSLPWIVVPILTWLYVIAAGLIVHSLLRRPLGTRAATAVILLWLAVLTWSTVRSFSGGSAEGPLLLFVTVAVTTLILEDPDETQEFRWLAAGALAGAVLTKSEGAVAALLVIAGTAIRDAVWRRSNSILTTVRLAAPALAAAGLWAAVKVAHSLPLTDPIRETAMHIDLGHFEVILKVCARLSGSGVLCVGWLVPIAAISVVRPLRPLRVLPGLAVAAGLPVFAVLFYLHATGDPVELIVWTYPRLIQPAISVWIVSLGVVCFATPAAKCPGSD